jgi:thiamine kinase-like enzyme
MLPSIEEALARVPQWSGRTDLQASFLAGGLTNQNFRVDVGSEAFVLRVSGAKTDLLGINRDHEHAATLAAASLGIAPDVVDFIQPEGWLVTRFVHGRPLPPDEMRQPQHIRRVAEALKRFHALPAIPGAFSPFRVVEDYDRIAREHGVTAFPTNYARLRARMAEVEAAFLKDPFVPAPCHNDLLNENFLLEPDGRVRILDWEYAGMGDRFFDLANFAVHHGFGDDEDHLLLEAYFGEGAPRRFARLRLMKPMSDFREAMWGVVQQGLSTLDYDFRGYADKHFQRMTQNFNDARYHQWLAEL